jgi:hypothetical protein
LIVGDRVDVIGLDDVVGSGQLVQCIERQRWLDGFLRKRGKLHRDRNAEDGAEHDQAGVVKCGGHGRASIDAFPVHCR